MQYYFYAHSQNIIQNPILVLHDAVKVCVEFFNDVDNKGTKFEFDFNEDSEISYFTSTDSVEDLGEAALQFHIFVP